MQNTKSMLSRITAEIPSSGEPQHPPALVVRLRGRQRSGVVLWVEPVSKCERYFLKQQRHLLKPRFSQNMKANLQIRGNRKRQSACRPLKHWKLDTNTNKQTFLKRCKYALFRWFDTDVYWCAPSQRHVNIRISAHFLSALVSLKSQKVKSRFKVSCCLICRYL